MLIFEFENGSIVNLLTMEALLAEQGRYFLVCQSGNKYELNKEEFDMIKTTFKSKLENVAE
jgi:hypothetical protein